VSEGSVEQRAGADEQEVDIRRYGRVSQREVTKSHIHQDPEA